MFNFVSYGKIRSAPFQSVQHLSIPCENFTVMQKQNLLVNKYGFLLPINEKYTVNPAIEKPKLRIVV